MSLEMVEARAVMDVLAKLWDDVWVYLGRGTGYATIALPAGRLHHFY